MRKRAVVSIAVVLALATFTAACGDDDSDDASSGGGGNGEWPAIPDGPIVFGVSAPLSGPTASFGLAIQKAFENVTEPSFNKMHPDGIAGHPIEIKILDDASDVTKAVSVANQMVAEKMAAVITPTNNPAAAPQQAAIFNKAKMPVLSAVLGQKEYTDTAKYPYTFSISASIAQLMQKTAEWIASHPEIEKIAVLSDGTPSSEEQLDELTARLKTEAPSVDIGTKETVSPGATDVSTAIAKLKAANPDLLYVDMGYGYGPVWQAITAANWKPKIFTSAGAWYDAFDAMGPLAEDGYAAYVECGTEGHEPFNDTVKEVMDGYASVFGTTSTNYLTFVTSDNGPLELLKVAIEKNNSIDPDAIKDGLETMGATMVLDTVEYNFTPTNHFGLTGEWGPNVCKLAPTMDGAYRIPIVAD